MKTFRQMPGGKDGQTLFYGIFPATARGLASTTAADWHSKVNNKTCDVGLIENYCITQSACKKSPQSINLFSTF